MPVDLRFSWDGQKDAANFAKHGVGFQEASRVFMDPLSNVEPDLGTQGRWRTFGEVEGQVLVVVHEDDEYMDHGQVVTEIRIISARFATPAEVRAYRDDSR